MRRCAALKRLSSEHHSGLVIARRARVAAPAPEAAWVELRQRFADELEPHFQLEERGLLPALQAAGEQTLVERTLAEHRALRDLIDGGGPADLDAFAQLLTGHIRFEENALFAMAQRVLGPDALAAIQDLHEREAGPSCRTIAIGRDNRT
jgi:iron-sulfur cluster repair protein YtfE (RIC family)